MAADAKRTLTTRLAIASGGDERTAATESRVFAAETQRLPTGVQETSSAAVILPMTEAIAEGRTHGALTDDG